MNKSEYREIGSVLLDHDLVDPDRLKKAIAAHKKVVEQGNDMSFLDFLVEKGLIDRADVNAHFGHEEEDEESLTLGEAPERSDQGPGESPTPERIDGHVQETYSRSRSNAPKVFVGLLLIAGLAAGYYYYQYTNSQSARKILKRAQKLEERQQYNEALTLLNDKLLESYSSTEAASKGKTLRSNVRKILKRKEEVDAQFHDLQEAAEPPDTLDTVTAFKQLRETLDRLNRLEDRYQGFLKSHFGPPSDPEMGPELLTQVDELRTSLNSRLGDLTNTLFQEKREVVRNFIQSKQLSRAIEHAKEFDRTYDSYRGETAERMTELAHVWIQEEYERTKKRIQQAIRDGKSEEGLPQFRTAMDQFGAYISQKRLTADREELQQLRVAVRKKNRKTDASDSKKRKPDQSEKDLSIPFNQRMLLTRDGTVIQGRIVDLNEEQVELITPNGERRTSLTKLRPPSAANVLHTVGKDREAIAYAINHEAYEMARRLLSGKSEGGPWRQASVQAANQFLDGAVQMSPQALREGVDRKEKSLQQKAKTKLLDRDEYEGTPVQAVERMVYNGDVSRRLDIVFVNDGWTKEIQGEYNKLCQNLVEQLLRVKPFVNYKRYINVHRVNLISEHTEIDGSTVLGTEIEGDDNSIVANWREVQEYGQYATDADLVVNVINKENARANGSAIRRGPGVINLNRGKRVGPTAVHELGHAFGDLDDEYVEEDKDRSYSRDEEDEHINTTRVSDPMKVKWHYWRFPEPPPGRRVGTFEGAYYNAEGYYRPSSKCRMRYASTNSFCVVCFEQMELSFYRRVSPLDRVNPYQKSVDLFKNEERRLLAHTIYTKSRGQQFGVLRSNWFLNARPVDNTHSSTLKTWVNTEELSLPPGTHQLAVHIDFQNERIRRDYGYLSDAHAWTVNVRRYEKPDLRIGREREAEAGSSFALPLQLDSASRKHGLRVKPLHLPPGAAFDGEKVRITWTPTTRQTGSHALRVGVVDTKRDNEVVLERTVRVTVNQPGRQNQSPLMYLPPVLAVDEGEPLNYRIKAWDPDNDFLTYRIPERPDGLILDRNTGRIHWKLGYRHGFEKGKITVIATDGHQQVSKEVTLVVMDKPLPDHQSLTGYNAMYALRSRNEGDVKHAFQNKLTNLPRMYQYLESIRLLRHKASSVRSMAIERIRTILEERETTMKKRYAYILFSRLIPHMFHFTDSPDVLDFVQSLVKRTKDVEGLASGAETLRSKLKAIRTYNRKRGASTAGTGSGSTK